MISSIILGSAVAKSVPFDNSTVRGYSNTNVQSALEEVRDRYVYSSSSTVTTASGTLTLNATSTTLQYLTGSAVGFSVILPDATTVPSASTSSTYAIANTTALTVSIKDNSGTVLFILSQNSIAYLYLQAAGSSTGTWLYWQVLANSVASGVINYNITSSTTFSSSASSDTLLTGMSFVPQAGTYAIWFNAQCSTPQAGNQITATIYSATSPITDSIRSALSPAGTHVMQIATITTAQFNGANACSVYVNPNGLSFSFQGRSLLLIRLGN